MVGEGTAPIIEHNTSNTRDARRRLRTTAITESRPRRLVVRAWLWLAVETDDLQKKRRCLNAVLQLDPENEPASLALFLLDQKRPTS